MAFTRIPNPHSALDPSKARDFHALIVNRFDYWDPRSIWKNPLLGSPCPPPQSWRCRDLSPARVLVLKERFAPSRSSIELYSSHMSHGPSLRYHRHLHCNTPTANIPSHHHHGLVTSQPHALHSGPIPRPPARTISHPAHQHSRLQRQLAHIAVRYLSPQRCLRRNLRSPRELDARSRFLERRASESSGR